MSEKENEKQPDFEEVPTAKQIADNGGMILKVYYGFKDEKEKSQYIANEYVKLIKSYHDLWDNYSKHMQYSNRIIEMKNVISSLKDQTLAEKELTIAQLQNRILQLEKEKK